MPYSFQKANISACCKQDENLSEHQVNPRLRVFICGMCKRRHFIFKAELSDIINVKEVRNGTA